jgi:cytoskeletal protein RodZ
MSSKRRHTPATARLPDPPAYAREDEQQQFDESYDDSQPSSAPRPATRQPVYEQDRIGDILRRVREHRGEDLSDISDYLRIRPNYLFALESSRYEDLPADAYVIGFLRTYAAYLGLDGKGAVDQYRREMAGRRRKPQLSMPQPMPEGRAPTIAMLIGAAILALLVFGVWYGLSSPDREVLDKPLELPATPQEIGQTQDGPADETTTALTPSSNDLTGQTATSDGIALSVPVTAVPTSQPEAASTSKTTPAANDTPASSETKTPEEPKAKPEETKPDAKTDKTGATSSPPVTETKTESSSSASFGDKGKSRMTIKAEKNSWILVTDSKGNTIFDRTLKPGETYNVPAGKGLKLTTSNPSDVAFSIDGKDMPKLKEDTAIVRAIPLEADNLKKRLTGSAPTQTGKQETNEQE